MGTNLCPTGNEIMITKTKAMRNNKTNSDKYELTNMFIKLEDGTIVYRIRALKDFGPVKAGEFGGYVQSYDNLSEDGRCWVFHNAIVCGNARIVENAWVMNTAIVSDNASIGGNSIVANSAIVCDNAKVYGKSNILHGAKVSGHAMIINSSVHDRAHVGSMAIIQDSKIKDISMVLTDAKISNSTILNKCVIYGSLINDSVLSYSTIIYDDSEISGCCLTNTIVNCHTCMHDVEAGNAVININNSIKDCKLIETTVGKNNVLEKCTVTGSKIDNNTRIIRSELILNGGYKLLVRDNNIIMDSTIKCEKGESIVFLTDYTYNGNEC